MKFACEIIDRHSGAADASALLYAPLARPLSYRATRRYEFDAEGDPGAVEAFARAVLHDPVSQEFHSGDQPALDGFHFLLDYGMKPGALDLEKETIVKYHRGLEDPGFRLDGLVIRQRVYVFGQGEADPGRFVRDLCNPAIQNWTVIQPAHA